MSNELLTSLIIIAVSALILHLKSHVKFITLGLFVGLVLAQTVSSGIHDFLASRWQAFNKPAAINSIQLFLLLVPTLVLGINHSSERKRLGLARTVISVVVTTLLLLSSITKFLPAELQQRLVDRSTIALQLLYYHVWLVVLAAVLVVVDSFHTKRLARAKKAKKDKL
ncbi:hypothetical protein HY441_00515 [Candidatus Microgenomates bacterium]|nr:hypothetical protein [Candidatus Microgenomates bacterium]